MKASWNIEFTVDELMRLVQVAQMSKLNDTSELWKKQIVEVEITEEEAQQLVKTIESMPLGGNLRQLESALPVYASICEKLKDVKP
jgi:hypothetical protein